MEVGRTTIRISKRARFFRNVAMFATYFLTVVVVMVCVVTVFRAGWDCVAKEEVFDGSTEDEKIANFRTVTVGKIKRGVLYRSASPINNSYDRAPSASRLLSKAGVRYVLNLSENEEELISNSKKGEFDVTNYMSLYEAGDVVLLHMDMKYREQKYIDKLVRGLTSMAENEGPYLIHCVEGKDRTGYVMMMLEALAGASYEEMVDDYMLTYDNYYGINRENEVDKYNDIKKKNIDAMLHYMIGDEAKERKLNEVADYSGYAREYLKSAGMSEEATQKLVERLEG